MGNGITGGGVRMKVNWTKEMESHLVDLKNKGKTWNEISQMFNAEFDGDFTRESCRSKYRYLQEQGLVTTEKVDKGNEAKPYKEELKIDKDGTHTSDKLILLSEQEMKDETAILKAHGYDPSEWELTSSQSSMWHHFNKEMANPRIMHASKIKAKPKDYKLDIDKLLEVVTQTPRFTIKPKHREQTDKYLLLSLFDMHFGNTTYKHYIQTQAKIMDKLKKGYKEVLIIFGQDAFHNDDFHGRTTKGTPIDRVDMVQAWKDATLFFEPIIKKS